MRKLYDLERKNKAIVIFKFFAALLITYSHMRLLFPRFGELVTGGAIGDSLFFFCSGFTLLLGRDGGFFNWYKRRVSRIYPSIIMWAVLSSVVFAWSWNVLDLITTPRYWFLPCIMVYYAIFYVIRRFLARHMRMLFACSFLLTTLLSFFILDMNNSVMYAQVSFMRIYYFMFMLMGAIVAIDLKSEQGSMIFGRLWSFATDRGGGINTSKSFCLFFISIILYYLCMALYKVDSFYCHFQIVSLFPLLLGIYYLFMFCSSDKLVKVFDHPLIGNVVYIISALTLEIYLVQYALFTDKLNFLFPLNILAIYLLIFIFAYILKILSQLFSHVFKESEMKISDIFKL